MDRLLTVHLRPKGFLSRTVAQWWWVFASAAMFSLTACSEARAGVSDSIFQPVLDPTAVFTSSVESLDPAPRSSVEIPPRRTPQPPVFIPTSTTSHCDSHPDIHYRARVNSNSNSNSNPNPNSGAYTYGDANSQSTPNLFTHSNSSCDRGPETPF